MREQLQSPPDQDQGSKAGYPVRADHYLHWLAVVTLVLFVWREHGLIMGIAAFAALIVIIAVTNIAVVAAIGSFVALRVNRWFWVAAAAAAFAMTRGGPPHV